MFIFKAIVGFFGLLCLAIGRATTTSVIIEHHHQHVKDRHDRDQKGSC